MASIIVFSENQPRPYIDKKSGLSDEEYLKAIEQTCTIYVGKYPFRGSNAAREAQIYTVFSQCGLIKRIIMGVNRRNLLPAGFCFVEYFDRAAALAALAWLNGTLISGGKIQVDLDRGFQEGRQYGRGESGFQIGDEKAAYRGKFNADRDIGEENRRLAAARASARDGRDRDHG
jgi:nuclear cap-binding protein subunit 2